MRREIVILTDYKRFFGSKQLSPIYRGGMNIPKLIDIFERYGYKAEAVRMADFDIKSAIQKHPIVLYTSSEDSGGLYKSYIEDVIYSLQESGILVVPSFKYLKAHNNKVAMELLRARTDLDIIKSIKSEVFGTFEDLKNYSGSFTYPVVIKPSFGAMSKGVGKADNLIELFQKARIISFSMSPFHNAKELMRLVKYRKNYIRESFHRNKFVVQNFISELNNDWKVLVYGSRCYVLYRQNRSDDFRASGSGKFEFRKELPEGMLDYALAIKNHFDVPHISLDIGFDGKKFHLIEFQCVYFGTTTLEKSSFYFIKKGDKWLIKEESSDLEETYVCSIVDHFSDNQVL